MTGEHDQSLPTNAQVMRSDHDLLIAMNTKLDIALNRQEDQERRIRDVESRPVGSPDVKAKVDDHETRIREIESRPAADVRISDHETRIRQLEIRSLFLAGVAAAVSAGGTVGLQRLIGG